MKEFRTVIQPYNSLIPSDLNRIVKSTNENTSYMENFQYSKLTSKEELFEFLNREIKSLDDQITQHQDILSQSKNVSLKTDESFVKISISESLIRNARDLHETAMLLKDFNQFVNIVQSGLNTTREEDSIIRFDTDSFGVKSNLGKNFQDLSNVNQKFSKVTTHFTEWSKFVTQQSQKQQEYSECSLITETDLEKIKTEMEKLESDLEDMMGMLGISTTKTFKEEVVVNQTTVDQLLML